MQSCGECKAKGVPFHVMDEGRKRVIGIMAAILASLHMRLLMICLEGHKEAPGRTS
jgi:hypothetical protein